MFKPRSPLLTSYFIWIDILTSILHFYTAVWTLSGLFKGKSTIVYIEYTTAIEEEALIQRKLWFAPQVLLGWLHKAHTRQGALCKGHFTNSGASLGMHPIVELLDLASVASVWIVAGFKMSGFVKGKNPKNFWCCSRFFLSHDKHALTHTNHTIVESGLLKSSAWYQCSIKINSIVLTEFIPWLSHGSVEYRWKLLAYVHPNFLEISIFASSYNKWCWLMTNSSRSKIF